MLKCLSSIQVICVTCGRWRLLNWPLSHVLAKSNIGLSLFFAVCCIKDKKWLTRQNLSGNFTSRFLFLLIISWFFFLTQVAGPSRLKMNTGALWDEVVDCIVLGSYPILEITIQSTVFPTVVPSPSTYYVYKFSFNYAVLHSGMCSEAMCPVPSSKWPLWYGASWEHLTVVPKC